MAAYTSLLLVIALCATTAYTLRCYTCESESSNSKCLTETTCPSGATSCLTTVATGSIAGNWTGIITKKCAQSCTPSTSSTNSSISVSCCSTDLCNYSGSTSIKSSYAAIILALGSILTILKSSVL